MSLRDEHKMALGAAVTAILQILNGLEHLPADGRALDLLEIAGSLLEQQIKQDVVFESCEEDVAHHVNPFEQQTLFFEEIDEETLPLNALKFLQDYHDNTQLPSPDQLRGWWNLN